MLARASPSLLIPKPSSTLQLQPIARCSIHSLLPTLPHSSAHLARSPLPGRARQRSTPPPAWTSTLNHRKLGSAVAAVRERDSEDLDGAHGRRRWEVQAPRVEVSATEMELGATVLPLYPFTSDSSSSSTSTTTHTNTPDLQNILSNPLPDDPLALRPILEAIAERSFKSLKSMGVLHAGREVVWKCWEVYRLEEGKQKRFLKTLTTEGIAREVLFEAAVRTGVSEIAEYLYRYGQLSFDQDWVVDLLPRLLAIEAWTLVRLLTDTYCDHLTTTKPIALVIPTRSSGEASPTELIVRARMIAFTQLDRPVLAIQSFHHLLALGLPAGREVVTQLFRCHLANHDLASANRVMETLVREGWNEGTEFAMALILGYRALGFDAGLEEKVLRDMREGRMGWDVRIVNSLIQLRVDADDAQGAISLLKHLDFSRSVDGPDTRRNAKVPADKVTFTIILNMASREGKIETVREIWSRILSNADRTDVEAEEVGALMRGLIRSGHLDDAVNVLEQAINRKPTEWLSASHAASLRLNSSCFNVVLSGLSQRDGLKGAKRVLRLMIKAAVKPDVMSIRWMVESLGRWTNSSSAEEHSDAFGKLMESCEGLMIDGKMLNLFLASEAKGVRDAQKRKQSGDGSKDAITVDDLEQIRVSQDLSKFDPTAGVIPGRALMRSELLSSAFRQPEIKHSKSSSRAFDTRLHLESRGIQQTPRGTHLDFRSIYSLILERGIRPTTSHFTRVMLGFINRGDLTRAHDWMNIAAQTGIRVDHSMRAVLAWGYAREGRWKECYGILDSVKGQEGAKSRTHTATTLAGHMIKSGQFREGAQVMAKAVPCDEMDVAALEVAFNALAHAKQFDTALALLDKHAGISWDKSLSESARRFVGFYRKRGEHAIRFAAALESIRKRKRPPRSYRMRLSKMMPQLKELLREFDWHGRMGCKEEKG